MLIVDKGEGKKSPKIVRSADIIQGDHSGYDKLPVDTKTNVAF